MVSSQDLPYITDQEVPDSIASIDYSVLRKRFFKISNDLPTNVDSLTIELYARSLITRAKQKELKADFAKFYSALGTFRGDIASIDYALQHTDKQESSDLYEQILIQKAIHLYNDDQFQESYDIAQEALKFAEKSKNLSNEWSLKNLIAVLLIENNKEVEGIQVLKEIEKTYSTDKIKQIFPYSWEANNKEILASVQYCIAMAYFDINELDSATYYISKIKKYAKDANDNDYYLSYLGLQAGIYTKSHKYKEGLKLTNQYLAENLDGDPDALSHSYAFKGIAHKGLQQPEEALAAFLKTDSLHESGGADYLFPELKTTYDYLLTHYKNTDNSTKQIEYLNKMITYEEDFGSLSKTIGDGIVASYTIPQLLSEKEAVIQSLEGDKKQRTVGLILLISLGLLALFYALIQYRKRRILKQRFENLRAIYSEWVVQETNPVMEAEATLAVVKAEQDGPLSRIKPAQLEKIQEGLDRFEKKALFTSHNVTLKSLAAQIGTNASYLSKYINVEKSDNFSTYLSDLRVNYVLKELYASHKLRSYTVAAIAEEIGFSNVKSFSTHFKRVTGLSVSYFIKNLEGIKETAVKKKDDNVIDFLERINKTG
ncbi:helix-turn-helix domain-containing protein [Dokdonia sp. MED134]|uniref:helix-turn-helix domain-containing protein n=1 Tax=Dokdonia sp. MED134 TaxID=313590 RepID=UPI0002D61CCA|nr:helix-turn-helix domain-containing protein [Dokdonia sp. MED134]